MSIDTIENVCTLLAVIIGTLYALFRYVKTPKRGWLLISVFFMTHLISDYYWTTYTLVMGENPDVSAFMAYLGWNIGYFVMFIFALHMRPEGTKGFFHPMIILPIPLGIWQFFIYLPFGGIINNIWEGVFATAIACVSMQVIIHYFMHNTEKREIPWLHATLLLFIIFEYGMWTSSCYDWDSSLTDPYYYFSFFECISLILIPFAISKCYEQRGLSKAARNVQETRLTILLQVMITVIMFFGTTGGYYIGIQMKRALPEGIDDPSNLKNIATTLFIISILLVIFIMMFILMIVLRYKSIERDMPEDAAVRRGRLNFVLTVIITFSLMIISILYTSKLFYRVSVTGAKEDGQAKVYSTVEDLENYLGVARSILWVTADTVDIMMHRGASQEEITDYIYKQTENQSQQFDENFTGIYAYINGEYIDGSGWVPPSDYRVEDRDWYKAAVDANGKTIIVSPYIDAQTKSIVITICKLLDDGGKPGDYKNREVVALDMIVNHVQTIADDVNIGGKGFCFVVNHDGMIIADHDRTHNGQDVNKIYGTDLLGTFSDDTYSTINTHLNGDAYTLFVGSVTGQWYVVIAISDKELLEETNRQLTFNILVSLIIFLLISFFYFLGYKNEQLNAKKMEEMRTTSMRREYEAMILKQKEVSANEANKAKSQFLAQMSHEIRTPINAVLGMNEMILRTTKEAQTMDYAKNIDSAGNTLLALINTILDFSKIEDGKMEIIPDSYETAPLINELINSISKRAEEKGLELITAIDDTLPCMLFGDDVRLKQVIVNLLTNAVKYTERGSVKLTVRNSEITNGILKLYVSVKDTGIGIKPEDIDRLSLSFQRLDEKKNRNIEGTGLGMSIVTNLLTLMGSKICVQSTYGEGSNFFFTINQKVIDETPIGNFASNPEASLTDRSDKDLVFAPNARVLVVDDNKLNLMVAANLLKLCHINPDAVASGQEAIEAMSHKTYDMVFLDHMMPQMDGVEALHEMLSQGLIATNTRMIVLTANAVVGAKEAYMKEGFDDYLSKPVEISNLVAILKKYLPKSAFEEKVPDSQEPKNTGTVQEDSSDKNSNQLYDLENLKAAGIDPDSGIEYCAGGTDAYFEILDFFTIDYETKSAKLSSYFENGNWSDYSILVHSIKGNLRTLGVADLAEKALDLEKASKNKDITFIMDNHYSFMEEYHTLKEKINAAKN
ncbi:hybrid sensor histidine kinase/response regulator [Butyrivibrio sp. AE3004]|uniref:hybrid sensor histidine kinase/response regulator n=1 Tax=Butyrivibrio sp. AE3004 TaxID=1506994 RepID=UPI0006901C26|nr:hybrid sensor histidine kinase/response regulator [Butyrivibrio sp. AE3004]